MQKALRNKKKVNVLMLSAGMISGAFRMMLDIIENINQSEYQIYVVFKPAYAEWGSYERDLITKSGARLIAMRGRRLFDLSGFWDLWKILHKEKIDILHCWDVLAVPGRIIGRLAGTKVVEEFANPPPALKSEISLKHYAANKLTSILVHGFVACSNGVMHKYRKQKPVFLKNKMQSVVHNCVEVPDLDMSAENLRRIRANYNLPQNDSIITNIGYFNEQKAQWDLLHAFRQVVDKRQDVRLVIVGWGRLEHQLKTLVKDLKLGKRVRFTGKLPRSKVFDILSITDLFVLSSHWEGFGIVLVEAMALGKPVVATDTDGSREVVEDGKSGIIIPPGQPQALGEAILSLLQNPERMQRIGRQGFIRVKQNFNCRQYARGYEAFYTAVMQL